MVIGLSRLSVDGVVPAPAAVLLELDPLGQRLQHVGRPALVEGHQDRHLIALGQLPEDVGQPLVVQRLGHLVPPLGRQLLQLVREVGGRFDFRGNELRPFDEDSARAAAVTSPAST